jgi:hypothetical protein
VRYGSRRLIRHAQFPLQNLAETPRLSRPISDPLLNFGVKPIIDPERGALCSTELERDRFGLPLRTETADIQH